MPIKLNGSGSGSVALNAPANTSGGSDISFTLPTADGTSGQVLQTNGSGALSFASSDNITEGNTSAEVVDTGSDGHFKVTTEGTERARVDSSGRLLVGGLTSPRTNIYVSSTNVTPFNQIETVVNGYSNGLSLINYSASGYDPILTLGLSKTNTQGANAIIAAGNDYGRINFVGNTGTDFRTGAYLIASCDNTPSSTSLPSRLSFGVTPSGSLNPVERLRIGNDGAFREATGVYGDYSGASANLCIDSTGHITRGSSSIRYKTQVEDLEDQYADALLECRPVWYRSTSKNDNPDWSFYGLIAEEVAEIDPRLVQWRTTNPVVQEDGTMEHVPCDPVPEGISYDRFVPHLLNLIKRQKEQIETLESRVAQLEGGAA